MFLVQEIADGAVVIGAFDEGFNGQVLAQLQRRLAVIVAHVFEHALVIGGLDHDRDRLVILGGATDHRGPADVDVLDRFGQRYVRFRDGLREWIQIHDHQIDWLKTALTCFGLVLRVTPFVKQPAVHTRVQSFDTPFQHLGKCSETGNLTRRDLFFF